MTKNYHIAIAAFGLALTLAGTTTVRAADTLWVGDASITSANGCAGGINQWEFWVVTYRPAGIGSNGADSYLSMSSARSAYAFKVTGASIANGASYQGVGITSKIAQITTTSSPSFVGTFPTFATTPAAPTTANRTLIMTFSIKNFFNDPECSVNVQANATLVP